MVVFECRVTVRADGTVEAEPLPESARFAAFDRSEDVVEVSSAELS